MGVCEICNTNDHKYKCPKCQKHKKETDSNGESICKEIIPPPPPPPLEPTERTFDEDALTENQLKAIESSPELKKMLKDSILQIYLQTLDTSLEPESVFDKLQGNQKFDEFYNLVLDLIK
ncbi:hypothetical protein HK103_004414 [Boothiomyces macroporosus]|uniref:HIT-type domain-containing protein n=1 Tax=Boothiomyces macroporosus TaxID=261099 RepID=A0AAD5Y8C2_9FUNG|nr:hypothetical protein HK103_004398 [Boothiomyces macroporosus]KAJ3257642.1 hypothetical protein HK103_004414 [Boothiomyces macroporosus]